MIDIDKEVLLEDSKFLTTDSRFSAKPFGNTPQDKKYYCPL